MSDRILKQEETMGKTFMQLADEAMAQAHAISVEEALQILKQDQMPCWWMSAMKLKFR